jgi:dTDP-4-amino-4,6-dideoxygalactose transaminase
MKRRKNRLSDLAIFGGSPAFETVLHVGCPNIGSKESLYARTNRMLESKWIANNGPQVQELEARIAARLGVRHCVLTANGTLALELVMRALGIKGEVILPSFTFIATANALQWQGITPTFCDIDPKTHSISPCQVERLITAKTSAILGVHLWGEACDVRGLQEIAERYRLNLVFDASHAFDCSWEGRPIGSTGDAEIFSFHATKFFNTFEGGAITTNNDDLARRLRLSRNFGFTGYDRTETIGINAKMPEVCAAMGLTNLESLEVFSQVNHKNYLSYEKGLEECRGLSLYQFNSNEKRNHQYVVVEVDSQLTGISRDLLLMILHEENCLARRYFYPGCHRMEPYLRTWSAESTALRHTERLASRVLVLPTGTSVSSDEIEQLCNLIQYVIHHGQEITSKSESDGMSIGS